MCLYNIWHCVASFITAIKTRTVKYACCVRKIPEHSTARRHSYQIRHIKTPQEFSTNFQFSTKRNEINVTMKCTEHAQVLGGTVKSLTSSIADGECNTLKMLSYHVRENQFQACWRSSIGGLGTMPIHTQAAVKRFLASRRLVHIATQFWRRRHSNVLWMHFKSIISLYGQWFRRTLFVCYDYLLLL